MSICLSAEELVELTGKKHRDAQCRVLVALGIEHTLRPDGFLLVSREHVEWVLGGRKPNKRPDKSPGPNWAALNRDNFS